MKVQKFGFQDQEDGAILRNRGAQRRYYYVSTEGFGSASYSMSN